MNDDFTSRKLEINDIKSYCIFLIGFFCTMPVFNLCGLSLYNYPLIIYIFLSLIRGNLFFSKKRLSLYFLLVCLFISSLISFTIVDKEWANYSLKFSLKISLLMLLLLFTLSEEDIYEYRYILLKGIFYAACAHLCWMFFQEALYIAGHIDLNLLVFGVSTPTQNGGLVLSGLSWERANPVIALMIGIIIAKNKFVKFVFFIGMIATASRTAMGMVAVLLFYDFFLRLRKKKLSLKTTVSYRKLGIILCIIIAVIFTLTNSTIRNYINYTVVRFERLFTGGNDYSTSSNVVDGHLLYYQWLIPTLQKLPIIQVLFGCGTGISGWVYSTMYGYNPFYGVNPIIKPWGLETDFVGLILGNGIIGAILYYYTSIKFFLKQNNLKLKKIMLIIIAGTFMYSFLTTSLSIILLIFCVPIGSQRNK